VLKKGARKGGWWGGSTAARKSFLRGFETKPLRGAVAAALD
jgi:hypothetical protein